MPTLAGRPTWVTHQDGIYLAEHVARSADGAAVSSYRKGILLERGPAGTPATLQLEAAAPQMAEALRAVVASPGWAARLVLIQWRRGHRHPAGRAHRDYRRAR